MCHKNKQQFFSEVRLLNLRKAKKELKVRSYPLKKPRMCPGKSLGWHLKYLALSCGRRRAETVKERVETWFLMYLQGFVSVFYYFLKVTVIHDAIIMHMFGVWKVVRSLTAVAWTGGTVVQGGTLGCRILGAELGCLSFISNAVWKMKNLQQVNDVIILCVRKNSVA